MTLGLAVIRPDGGDKWTKVFNKHVHYLMENEHFDYYFQVLTTKEEVPHYITTGNKCAAMKKQFTTFADMRNLATENCPTDWILFLDSDEFLDVVGWKVKFKDYVAEQVAEKNADAYAMHIYSAHTDKRGGTFYKDGYMVRLFRNDENYYWDGNIHENIGISIRESGGLILDFPVEYIIKHLGYDISVDELNAKIKRNTQALERELNECDDPKRLPVLWYYMAVTKLLDKDFPTAKLYWQKLKDEGHDNSYTKELDLVFKGSTVGTRNYLWY